MGCITSASSSTISTARPSAFRRTAVATTCSCQESGQKTPSRSFVTPMAFVFDIVNEQYATGAWGAKP